MWSIRTVDARKASADNRVDRTSRFHRTRGYTFGTNGVPTIRTGFKSAVATVWFAAEPDLTKRGAGSSKLAAPTAAKPIVKPAVKTIRRVWFMRGQRQPVIFVPVVTATGQVHAGGFGFT
jgi:hypothetical protein